MDKLLAVINVTGLSESATICLNIVIIGYVLALRIPSELLNADLNQFRVEEEMLKFFIPKRKKQTKRRDYQGPLPMQLTEAKAIMPYRSGKQVKKYVNQWKSLEIQRRRM